MTVKGGTAPACAVCKYQRRKCTPDCPLAPYFPANQPKMFQNVHRLFGVSNITKTLNSLKTKDQKEDAMKSLVYEAEMRERFPVYGCSVIICQLRYQLQCALDELRAVQSQLAVFRDQSEGSSMVIQRQPISNNEMIPFNQNNSNQFLLLNEPGGGLYPDSCSDSNLTAIQSQMDALNIFQDGRTNMFSHDYEGMFVNMKMEDRQHYVDTKEAFESSSDGTIQQQVDAPLSDRELKSAAAGFSLTTFNL